MMLGRHSPPMAVWPATRVAASRHFTRLPNLPAQPAWGQLQLKETQLRIDHYDLGVLITPRTSLVAATAAATQPFACGPFGPAATARAAHVAAAAGPAPVGASAPGAPPPGVPPAGPLRLVTTAAAAGAARAGGLVGRTLALPLPYPLPPRPYQPGDTPWDIGPKPPEDDD